MIREYHAGEVVEFGRIHEIKSVLKDWMKNRSSLPQKYEFGDLEGLSRSQLTKSLLEFLQIFN